MMLMLIAMLSFYVMSCEVYALRNSKRGHTVENDE